MFIGEPPPSQGDIHFRVFDIPVRVQPFFWLMAVVLGYRLEDPVFVLIWMAVVFVSILVHELGHALLMRRFGARPWITLYHFGGLASSNSQSRSSRERIIELLGGPGAGFALAGLVILMLYLTGRFEGFVASFVPVRYSVRSENMHVLVWCLLSVNIYWGLLNLLPVYPLDGGQIAREMLVQKSPWDGVRRSLILSVATGIFVAVLAVLRGQFFLGILFGMLAYSSYSTLQAYTGGGGSRPW